MKLFAVLLIAVFLVGCLDTVEVVEGRFENEIVVTMNEVCESDGFYFPGENVKLWDSYIVEEGLIRKLLLEFYEDKGWFLQCGIASADAYWIIMY